MSFRFALCLTIALTLFGCVSTNKIADQVPSGYQPIQNFQDQRSGEAFSLMFDEVTGYHALDFFANGVWVTRLIFGDELGQCYQAKPRAAYAYRVNCYQVNALKESLEGVAGWKFNRGTSEKILRSRSTPRSSQPKVPANKPLESLKFDASFVRG